MVLPSLPLGHRRANGRRNWLGPRGNALGFAHHDHGQGFGFQQSARHPLDIADGDGVDQPIAALEINRPAIRPVELSRVK